MKSIYDLCLDGIRISNIKPIKSPLVGKAYIYGFVPYQEDLLFDSINCPPLGTVTVIGNRVIFFLNNKMYRFPIFSSVEKNTKENLPVHLLYSPRLMNLKDSYKQKAYLEAMGHGICSYNLLKIDGIQKLDDKPFYFPNSNEFFFESQSLLKGIADAFLVIITRISEKDGSTIYEAYDPNTIEMFE